MFQIIYWKLAPYLAPFFLLTTIVFFSMCVWRGEIILGLQAELIKDKNQEVKVIIEQVKAANEIGQQYEQRKADREELKVEVTHEIEKIVSVPLYSNLCFDYDGLHLLNSQISTINSTAQPDATLPPSKEFE